MKALIKTKDGFYSSTIFAFWDDGWKSYVIAFDESIARLVIIPWAILKNGRIIRRNVLLFDESEDNWVTNKKWRGFDFIVNNKDLLYAIKKGRDIPSDIFNKCKEMQTTETFVGWNSLDTNEDITKLMNITQGFHDGSIENIEHHGNNVCVVFLCWSCRIVINFINVVKSDEGKGISWDNNYIFEAAMCVEDGNVKWYVSDFGINEYENQACYFVAKTAQYKIELLNL